MSSHPGTRRLIVMAHWDPDGLIAPHVRYCVGRLRGLAADFVFVSSCELAADDLAWAAERARVIRRPNTGYDFASYKRGLAESDLGAFDEVVILNDSIVFPLVAPETIFGSMRAEPCDFWGLTGSDHPTPHVQSFFLVFGRRAVASAAFRRFWAGVNDHAGRREAIQVSELGLSRALLDADLTMGRYFAETPAERRRAIFRSTFAQVGHALLGRQWGLAWALLRAGCTGTVVWDPSVDLADLALADGRLPYVKLRCLRYDPRRMGARRLLTWCEEAYPEAFAGVREHLKRTDAAFGTDSGRRRALAPFPPHYRR